MFQNGFRWNFTCYWISLLDFSWHRVHDNVDDWARRLKLGMAVGDDGVNQCTDGQEVNSTATHLSQSDSLACSLFGMATEGESDMTPLMQAAWLGHLEIVHTLLNTDGIDVNQRSSKFGSALHIAAHHGHTDVVESLLRKEVYINQDGPDSETPLFVAAASGNQDIVRTLLMAGADTKLCNNEGLSPLHVAVIQNQSEIVRLLLRHGSNINKQDVKGNLPIHYAVRHKNTQLVQILLEAGSKKDSMNVCNENCLFIAVYSGDLPTLHLLISSGCDVNVQKQDGSGLLHAVVSRSSSSDLNSSQTCDIMEVLIAAGCHLNICAFSTLETPLYRALSLQKYDLAQVLISHGANPNLSSPFDITALHLACKHENIVTVNLLLHSGIDWKRERWIEQVSYFQSLEDAEIFQSLLLWRCKPMSLLNLSRISIRRHFKDRLVSKIHKLKVPKLVKNFLLFSDICDSGTNVSSHQYFDEGKSWSPTWESSEADVAEGPFTSRKSDKEDITD